MAKVTDIVRIIETFAPKAWAESWDNCGLQIGEEDMEVQGILVALELTEDVLQEAIKLGTNLIVTHHPLIFKPLSSIRTDRAIGRTIKELILNGIAVISAHTNFDRSPEGMNAYLARQLGMVEPRVLESPEKSVLKLVLFVPAGYEESVRDALTSAGAGAIGEYSRCTFMSTGQGSFLPGEGTQPFIGTPGELERVDEIRIETVFPSVLRSKVMSAMFAAHPYEEPAYDLYPLTAPAGPEGLGRIGRLRQPLPWEEFLGEIKRVFGIALLPVGGGKPPKTVRKVAITAGAGSDLIEIAARKGADVYLTGDIKYHEYRRGEELLLTLIDIGHFASENVGVFHMAELIKEAMDKEYIDLDLTVSQTIQAPSTLL